VADGEDDGLDKPLHMVVMRDASDAKLGIGPVHCGFTSSYLSLVHPNVDLRIFSSIINANIRQDRIRARSLDDEKEIGDWDDDTSAVLFCNVNDGEGSSNSASAPPACTALSQIFLLLF
jgi:hypothetical protein